MPITRNLQGVGTGAAQAKAIVGVMDRNKTATGTTRADAYLLSEDVTIFTVVPANTGAALRSDSQENDVYTVVNSGANALKIYPPIGGTVDGAGVNVAYSLAAGSFADFQALGDNIFVVREQGYEKVLAVLAASTGSSLVGFSAAGTSPRSRTVEAKLRDFNSVADRTGIDSTGATDSATAFNNAVTSASQNWVPSGTYLLDAAVTVASGKALMVEAGTTINYGSGDSITNNGIIYGFGGLNHTLSGTTPETTRGFSIIQNNIAGTALSSEPNEVDFNLIKISGDSVDVEGGAGAATKANGLAVLHRFGGSNATGGRHGLYSFLELTAATSASSTDRNYVAFQSWFLASANDGGTGGSKKGAAFGASSLGQLAAAATHFQNVTAHEFNTAVAAGTAPDYRSGIQIASRDADRGVTYDGMISLSDISSTANGKWLNCLLIGNQNSQHPLDTTNGTIIKTTGSATIKDVIDVSSYTISGALLRSTNVILTNSSLTMNGATPSIEMGKKDSANTPFIDFNSSGLSFDYDARIIVGGGSGSAGNGTMTLTAGKVVSTNSLEIATAGKGLAVKEGSNAKQGTATLVAGTVTVSNTSVTANSRIFLTSQADGGTPGFVRVSARVAGTSFTITSSNAADTSTVAYQIFEPAA